MFYSSSIQNNKNNPKVLWKHLKSLSNKTLNHQTNYINDEQEDPITDPLLTAKTFNEFFLDTFATAPTSNGDLNTISEDIIKNFISNKLCKDTEFKIPLITAEFVINQLKNLDICKSTGLDNIGARFLKVSSSIIAIHLAKIFNLSIQQGSFPDKFKLAKIIPIHKKGAKEDKHNYRPISILPVLSKIIEKHVSNEIKNYINENSLLHARQSGFRANHSCETALNVLIDDWITALNNHSQVGTIFLDLTKAFDLINHSILLKKLKLYQFSSTTLNWFTSYLTNRSQTVMISGKMSEPGHITSGVPQGSVLGPLLFILYINDLPLHVTSQIDMFADDTTISTYGNSSSEIHDKLQDDLQVVENWCLNNSMRPNAQKTKAMFITPSNKNSENIVHDKITMAEQEIEFTRVERLLGIYLDSNLTWKNQVEQTLKKCNSLLYLLLRIKCFININVRKLFFNAYILPHLDYCCTIWGNTSKYLLNEMLKFQKRAARIILDKEFDAPSEELFFQLRWMKFHDRLIYKKAILVYKSLHNECPEYLANRFCPLLNSHGMTLRSTTENLLIIPKPNLECFRKSISYSGAKIWNEIPMEIRSAESTNQFKQRYLRWKFPEG